MQISLDLGYGYTKGISGKQRIIIPSVIGPAQDSSLDYGSSYDHILEFKKPGEMQTQKVFVGELAIETGRAAQASLSRDKFSQKIAVVLAMTAAYLLGAEKQVGLITGLPLVYYKNKEQRMALEKMLSSVNLYASVDGGPMKYISFSQAKVFPQGVGVLFAQNKLPDNGLLGVIDIGFFTTDFLLINCTPNGVRRIEGADYSIETGVSTAIKILTNRITQLTGAPLPFIRAQRIWESGEKEMFFRGRTFDIGQIINDVKEEVGRAVAESVQIQWSEHVDNIRHIYLAGGGALVFQDEINKVFPQSQLVQDAQWANAVGFYRMAGGVLQVQSEVG